MQHWVSRYIAFSFFLSIFHIGKAQDEYIERHLTIKDGLPSNQTYETFETEDGDIWFCTDRGLARFDGRSINVYNKRDGLVDNVIFRSYTDHKGRVWLLGAQGVSFLKGDTITTPGFSQTLSGHPAAYIYGFHVDSLDQVYVGLSGIFRGYFKAAGVDADSARRVYFQELPDTTCSKLLYCIKKGNKVLFSGSMGTVYPGSCNDSILMAKVPSEPELNVYGISTAVMTPGYNRFTICLNRDDELVYYSVYDKMYRVTDKGSQVWKTFESDVMYVALHNDLTYVSLRGKGVQVLDSNGTVLQRLLGNKTISGIYFDPNGKIWMNTLYDGVYQLNQNVSKIYQLPKSIDLTMTTSPFYIDNDTLYLISDNFFRTYRIGQNDLIPLEAIELKFGMYSKLWKKLCNWATPGKVRFNYHELYYKPRSQFRIENTWEGQRNMTNSMDIGIDTVLIIGKSGFYFSVNNQIVYSSKENGFKEHIKCAEVITPQNIFFGTLEGLFQYKNNEIIDLGKTEPRLQVRIEALQSIGKDIMFVGTQGSGLGIIQGNTIQFIDESNGLNSNLIQDIEVIGNQIWVATNRELAVIDYQMENGLLKIGNTRAVLSSLYINDIHHDKMDNIYAQSGTELIRIKQQINTITRRPKIICNNVLINGVSRRAKWDSTYTLAYNQNNIALEFELNELEVPSMQLYSFKLEGFDSDWHNSIYNEVSYSNLDPGKYAFLIKARNSYGEWTTESARINFDIRPHFTDTVWFRYGGSFMLVILLLGVTFWYIRSRHRRLENENSLLNSSLNSLKLEMNPHFIFNALNSIQYFIANNQKREANLFLAKFATLIRNVLNATDQKKVTLTDEIAKLTDYLELERLRMQQHFEYKIVAPKEVDHDEVHLPPMLLQPILENAIWHGISSVKHNGSISVEFCLNDSVLMVKVQDNGKGMDLQLLDQVRTNSRGIRNIRSRLELMSEIEDRNYSIELTSQLDQGTTVVITIPQ